MTIKTYETQSGHSPRGSQSSTCAALASGEYLSAEFIGEPARPKVMMVDDDKLNSFVIAEYLKSDGYRDLVYTTDPYMAVSLGRHVLPGLILLDLQMPELSGFDILRALRADDAFYQTAIVVLTASHDETLKARAIELGAADFLHKGIDRVSLLTRLRDVVKAAVQDQSG
jgi:DNA-binding response OmpR family regulator